MTGNILKPKRKKNQTHSFVNISIKRNYDGDVLKCIVKQWHKNTERRSIELQIDDRKRRPTTTIKEPSKRNFYTPRPKSERPSEQQQQREKEREQTKYRKKNHQRHNTEQNQNKAN